jgi:hypothetical protein
MQGRAPRPSQLDAGGQQGLHACLEESEGNRFMDQVILRGAIAAGVALTIGLAGPAHAEPKWVPATNGSVPPGAVAGGEEATGETLYVCRASYMGSKHPGKTRAAFQGCNFPYGGKEIGMHVDYDVLVDRGGGGMPAWVAARDGVIPKEAVLAGQELGLSVFVCRGRPRGGGLHLGKIRADFHGCALAFNGAEEGVDAYEVLVAPKAILATAPGQTATAPQAAPARPQQPSPQRPPLQQAQMSTLRRVALVIGNSEYRSAPVLPNPRRDAGAVADALRQDGFQAVELATDLDRDGMMKALRAFRDRADNADWAVVYFAGHGIEIERVNYLIPVDARLRDDRDVKAETVSYEDLLTATGGARALRIIVLDACRNNPFKDRMRRTVASRSATDRGLAAPPETEPGTLVVYSAREGDLAADDADGVNSPFARAFVAQLKVPDLEVRRLFDFVRDDVIEATGRRQQPFTYGSLPARQDFFFFAAK